VNGSRVPLTHRAESPFEDFEAFDIHTSATIIHGVRGGDGPPILLLHGIPETHLMWHRVAPDLAKRFTVVATDLRGYGSSSAPPSTPDHAPYSMREIARDQIEVMDALGYDKFSTVGHDRGGRCAYRMALDHAEAILRLAVLDVVPTGDVFSRADKDFSLGFWVWSFLAAPEPIPEELVAGAPDLFVNHMLDTWAEIPGSFPDEVRAEYIAQFRDRNTVHAICEEYRAAATLDPSTRRRRPGDTTNRLSSACTMEPQRSTRRLVRPAGDMEKLGR
jgi:haloacetate dehalogenase